MSKATRTVHRSKETKLGLKYQSPFGPRPTIKKVLPGVQGKR